MKKITLAVPSTLFPEVHEATWEEIKLDADRQSWRGRASTLELPHNEGSIDRKVDDAINPGSTPEFW
jgi:hypothetical protein